VVLVHDAARIFASRDEIQAVIHAAAKNKAATLAMPIADTLKYKNADYVDRTDLWAIQTPQGFHYNILKTAHENATMTGTDDTSLVNAIGYPPALVEGSRRNFKITTEDDLMQARQQILSQNETRTGQGFDVHAFDTSSKGPLTLCGIDIAHTHKLKGHSDADVALHTITDALLGALGAGDIGIHFPPTDPQWKGYDSAHFLRHAVNMLDQTGGAINNIDLTIICEAPKLMAYRAAMEENLANICQISAARVNVKATTTETLGFTGRGEGIAAQAIVTITVPFQDEVSNG